MGLFDVIALLITVSALFSYVNHRVLRMPTTIGLMLMALALSLTLTAVGHLHPGIPGFAQRLLAGIDFNRTLLHGMLGFMLFAGALHVDLDELRQHKLVIFALATVGVLISTALVGGMAYYLLQWLSLPTPLVHCLLFGALISPTDPIAVLGILKQIATPRELDVQITGESLFNDGIGVVVFLALAGFATAGTHGGGAPADIAWLFLKEAGGGAAWGLASGSIAYYMLKSVDNYQVEVLLTLALVTGAYAAADALHISGPIAMVIAGLFIGNHGRAFAMSDTTREHLDMFWELVDEILNAVLFVLIGLEVIVLTMRREYVLTGLLMVPTVLLARLISVAAPVTLVRPFAAVPRHAIKLMTWGGLRGGISVAMALSLRNILPAEAQTSADLIVVVTYIVVVFSVVVQGLTIGPMLRRLVPDAVRSAKGA